MKLAQISLTQLYCYVRLRYPISASPKPVFSLIWSQETLPATFIFAFVSYGTINRSRGPTSVVIKKIMPRQSSFEHGSKKSFPITAATKSALNFVVLFPVNKYMVMGMLYGSTEQTKRLLRLPIWNKGLMLCRKDTRSPSLYMLTRTWKIFNSWGAVPLLHSENFSYKVAFRPASSMLMWNVIVDYEKRI